MNRLAMLCLILSLLSIPVQAQASLEIISAPATVGLYEKFELVLNTNAEFENPYDPQNIRLDALFIAPSGREMLVAGFYYRDFAYSLENGQQSLGWLENFDWRVRFTPTEMGEWQYQLILQSRSGTIETEMRQFEVHSSDEHGFIRLSPRNPRYLEYDDGSFYMPIGENMAWYGEGRMADYQRWLDALSASGGNYIRVWMNEWGFGIEALDTGLGTYGGRQDRMYELDRLLEMLHERDMTMMLTLLDHTAFSLVPDSRWGFNPYNSANGGMLSHPAEFATHPEAQRLWEQRLRYILARWGYSPQIMALEWWNEVYLTPLAHPRILIPWIERSAAYLQSLDPYDHLVTISGVLPVTAQVWDLPSLDFVQEHNYFLRDWARDTAHLMQFWRFRYEKPLLLAEFGYLTPPEYDPLGIRLHLGLWSAPMNGTMGSGMFWWWDIYTHPQNHYPHIAGIAAFFADEDLAAYDYALANASTSSGTSVYGLQTENRALLWLVRDNYNDAVYAIDENPVFPEVCDIRVELRDILAGQYHLEWWDTMGHIIHEEDISLSENSLSILAPCFRTDLALKIRVGAS